MRKFWISRDKKIKPPYRHYYNLMPWHYKLGSEKILKFHNALFVKYKQQIDTFNKASYLKNPIISKVFKNIKNSNSFRLSKELKSKLNEFRKFQYKKKSKKRK
jgi:hypothetical protein